MSQMALDISSRRTLQSASSPSSMTSSSPSSPNHASMDSQAEIASSQYLKAISEGASRILSQQQHTLLYNSSPSSSLLDSPQQSPLQDHNSSHNSVSPQPQSHSTALSIVGPTIASSANHNNHSNHANHQQSSVRLKFSIDHILSPEFGKNGTECIKKVVNGEKSKSNHKNRIHHPLDVSSLTNNKRKHSSDSESSTISSLSNASRDTFNNSHNTNKKEAKNGRSETSSPNSKNMDTKPNIWPAWVYCTRYSDRPSSGPRSRKIKKKDKKPDEKRPRTAFTAEQLARLKQEFQENRYLNEKRRQDLARDLKLNESQIKIWFQNKRAKIKKSSGNRNPLALHLMAQGLYNHSTVADGECDDDDDDSDERDSSCVSPIEHNKLS